MRDDNKIMGLWGCAAYLPTYLSILNNQSKELQQFNIYKMHSNFNLEFL